MRLKIIFAFLAMMSMFVISCEQRQIPRYFEKLQSEKVKSADIVSWRQFGPGSAGYCDIVEYHPTIANCVIMSPDMYNNYRSLDNGATWQTINDCDGTSLGVRRMRDISFSRQNPDYGVMIDERGWFWTTHDLGGHWQRKDFPAQGVCSVVSVDPGNDKIIYVGSGNFWNVKWNKRTLARPRREIPRPSVHYNIKCDLNIPLQHNYQNTRNRGEQCDFDVNHYSRTDYGGVSVTEYGKVWRTTDGGMSWKIINTGMPEDLDVGKILFHPLNSKILYMATNYGLYKSENRGEEWTNIGVNLPHNMLRDLAVYLDEKTQKAVLVVIDQVFWNDDKNGSVVSTGGVFKSSDEGTTWEPLNNNLYLDLTKVSPVIVNSWYRAISSWFEMSSDEAKIKFPRLPKRAIQNFNRILLDPTNPQRMYIGHNAVHDISFIGGDLWRTENGGKQWIVCNRTGGQWEGADKKFWENRGNPTNPNMKFAHLQRQEMENPYGGRVGCRALTINSRGDLIAVMEQQTLQSTNHGNTWQQIDAVETSPGSGCWVGSGCSNLTRPRYYMDNRLEGQYLLLSGEHGMWQLCDSLNNINPKVHAVKQVVGQACDKDDPLSISTVAIHPENTNIRYMQMYRQEHSGHIRRTTDGGKTWQNISKPIKFSLKVATDRLGTQSLLIEKDAPEHMYFSVFSWDKVTDRKNSFTFNDFGVYHSSDAGYNWQRVNNGLPAEANVEQLCFDPDNHKILYAALMKSLDMKTKGGLYRTENRGKSWHALPIPDEIESVNYVYIDKRNKYIYIACGLSDGPSQSGGVWVSRDNGQTWKKIFHMPFVYQVTVAEYDSNRIAAAVAENTNINNLNPGAYLSFDGGKTWSKSNQGLGQPYWIVDLKFDIKNPDVIWCGLNGSGWYKGIIDTKHSAVSK